LAAMPPEFGQADGLSEFLESMDLEILRVQASREETDRLMHT
jgi:hypothetical protein